MLSGDRNENAGQKKISESNYQKNIFARAGHFFVHFFCRCFGRIQRETSKNFLVTRVTEEILEGSSTVTRSNFFPPVVKYASSRELKIPRRR